MVPYIEGLSESFNNICSKYGIQMHFKGGKTIRDLLSILKDKDTLFQKSEMIYRYKCGRVDCEEKYIGRN